MVTAMKLLTNTRDVMAALGGISECAALTGRSYNAACNWGDWETFPADTYCAMTAQLRHAKFRAPPSLWRQTPAYPLRRKAS
jgi:hypothetical protein